MTSIRPHTRAALGIAAGFALAIGSTAPAGAICRRVGKSGSPPAVVHPAQPVLLVKYDRLSVDCDPEPDAGAAADETLGAGVGVQPGAQIEGGGDVGDELG